MNWLHYFDRCRHQVREQKQRHNTHTSYQPSVYFKVQNNQWVQRQKIKRDKQAKKKSPRRKKSLFTSLPCSYPEEAV